jgi:hypothetical protein
MFISLFSQNVQDDKISTINVSVRCGKEKRGFYGEIRTETEEKKSYKKVAEFSVNHQFESSFSQASYLKIKKTPVFKYKNEKIFGGGTFVLW